MQDTNLIVFVYSHLLLTVNTVTNVTPDPANATQSLLVDPWWIAVICALVLLIIVFISILCCLWCRRDESPPKWAAG